MLLMSLLIFFMVSILMMSIMQLSALEMYMSQYYYRSQQASNWSMHVWNNAARSSVSACAAIIRSRQTCLRCRWDGGRIGWKCLSVMCRDVARPLL